MKSLRYLVWGYYGYGNLGDELMLKVIVDKIRKNDPGAAVYVRCMDRPYAGGVIPFPIEKNRFPVPVLKHLIYLFRQLVMMARIDRLLIGGGTLFLDKGQRSQSIFFMASAVFFAKLFGKNVYVIGVGMDELSHPSSLPLLKYILDKSEYSALRDDFSYDKALSLTEGSGVVRSSDILFDSSFVDSMLKGPRTGKKHIVVSISDYFATWGTEQDRQALRDGSDKLVGLLLKRFSGRCGIVLCAFQKNAGEKDLEFLSAVLERATFKDPMLGESLRLVHLKTEAEARTIFEEAVFTIGMRYHALVLSAMFKKPFLGIDVEMKISQICKDFGMPCAGIREFLKEGIGTGNIDLLENAVIDTEKADEAIRKAGLNFAWLDRGVIA